MSALTYEELLTTVYSEIPPRRRAGIYTVENEPVSLFKKVACECKYRPYQPWLWRNNQKITAVVELEATQKARIVRPHQPNHLEDQLRTDRVSVIDIRPHRKYGGIWENDKISDPHNYFDCQCSSMVRYYDPVSYRIGATVTPKLPLNTDLHTVGGSGIHVFLDYEQAKNYTI